jgi:hypothetical protein
LKAWHRNDTTCYDALAAGGESEEAAPVDEKERKQLGNKPWPGSQPIRAVTRGWKKAANCSPVIRITPTAALAARPRVVCVRDWVAQATLRPDEQMAFTHLWADVAALLKKAQASANEDSK